MLKPSGEPVRDEVIVTPQGRRRIKEWANGAVRIYALPGADVSALVPLVMRRHFVSAKDLARFLGVTPARVYQYANGALAPEPVKRALDAAAAVPPGGIYHAGSSEFHTVDEIEKRLAMPSAAALGFGVPGPNSDESLSEPVKRALVKRGREAAAAARKRPAKARARSGRPNARSKGRKR